MSKNTGGPAFPHDEALNFETSTIVAPSTGMTLRDYFAAKALGVMCASNVNATGSFADAPGRATVASVCYLMADAMIVERAA